MTSVHNVAAYILERESPMSTWKLQKLAYYSQAWHLAWEENRLFEDRIEAWANGPVTPVLYQAHRGEYTVSEWDKGDSGKLADNERETIDIVLKNYGHLDGRQLSFLTHEEDPWKIARGDCPPNARCSEEITPESMQEYYQSLDLDSSAPSVSDVF